MVQIRIVGAVGHFNETTTRRSHMVAIESKYFDQAVGPAQTYSYSDNPIRCFRVPSGQGVQLMNALANGLGDDYGLQVRDSGPSYRVLDNVGDHWGTVTVRGTLLEVDSSPAAQTSRPEVATGVFWIRFGTMLYLNADVSAA